MGLPKGRWRLWLDYYRDELRLARAALIAALGLAFLIGGFVWLLYPTGPAQTVQGRVEAFGFYETDFGSVPTASVSVDGRPVRIDLPARYGCMIGDRIALRRSPNRLGFAYKVGLNPRPCSRD